MKSIRGFFSWLSWFARYLHDNNFKIPKWINIKFPWEVSRMDVPKIAMFVAANTLLQTI